MNVLHNQIEKGQYKALQLRQASFENLLTMAVKEIGLR